MIDWLFRRKKAAPQPGAARPASTATPAAPAAPAAPAPATARPPAADWAAMLARAQDDDDALLALACGAAPLDVRLAAVDALASEAALERAERGLRKSDRRTHRRARQRLAERSAQRETQARAAQLIASARAMRDETPIAANRLVELDRAWQALDTALLADTQAADFAALFERLTALEREHADRALGLVRWHAAARQAGADLACACAQAAAATIDRTALAACVAHAQAVLGAAPDDADATQASRDALRAALQGAAEVATRVEIIDALSHAAWRGGDEAQPSHAARRSDGEAQPSPAPDRQAVPTVGAAEAAPDAGPAAEAAPARAQAGHEAARHAGREAARPTADEAARVWGELAPLADRELARMLDARFAHATHSLRAPAPAPRPAAAPAAPGPRARLDAIVRRVEQAEAALADGRIADLGKPLAAIERHVRDAAAPPVLRERIDTLRAEAARLRGWQDWGGARARDELVAQAEALAAAGAGSADAQLAKITTRQRSGLITEMRARWKELDRHGGGAPRALWQRFDAALRAAHAPVAAQAEARRAARETNLAARVELLAALEAVALPVSDAPDTAAAAEPPTAPATALAAAATPAPAPAATRAPAATPAPAPSAAGDAPVPAAAGAPDAGAGAVPALGAAPDARAIAVALANFHAAWRKLGPLEHTVPHAERERLLGRMNAAVARLDAPLRDARRGAHAQREALIASARALVAPGAARGRDGVAAAQALQARWKQAAQALPLARTDEAALWADFRAAIDAAFAAWNAQASARDAALEAGAAARGALLERLERATHEAAADATHGALDLERTLAEVDAQWRDAGAAPRAQAALLDARFRTARSAAQARLGDAARRRWQLQCDALAARLAEPGAVPDAARTPQGGPALPAAQDGVQAAPPLAQGRPHATSPAPQPGAQAAPSSPHAASAPPLPALPERWENALARRAAPPPDAAMPNDDLLLRLEAAFGLESPPEQRDARRALKLHAMKAALETRNVAAPATADTLLVEALARGSLDAAQRDRLRAVVAALRDGPPPGAG